MNGSRSSGTSRKSEFMFITLHQLNRATLSAQAELGVHGFWSERTRLLRTDVCLIPCPPPSCLMAAGFFTHGKVGRLGKWLGYDEGNIYIPAHLGAFYRFKAVAPKRVLSMLGDLSEARCSLRDVIRHEYGHAVAHWYPRLIQRSTRFAETFGGNYWAEDHRDAEDQGDFVSDYAMTMPKEDFAETFMHFLRHQGVLPKKFGTRAVKRKWRFISDLGKAVGNGKIAWS